MTQKKDIMGFESFYEASEDGHIYNKRTHKELWGDINNAGYRRVLLSNPETGKKRRCFVHRLIAETFIPNPDGLPEVNHIDADKNNNSVSNLEWTDRIANQRNCIRQVRSIDYKPFQVIWDDGKEETFEFNIDLAQRVGLTRRSI